MSRSNPPLVLWAAVAASVSVVILAARLEQRLLVLFACKAFMLAAVFAAYGMSKRSTSATPSEPAHVRLTALVDSTSLAALVYAWGGLSMLGVYRLTPLHWQHGWQYGSAMLLIAAALTAFAYWISLTQHDAASGTLHRMIALALLHGLSALGALAWLVLSGKLATPKADWAANNIFVAGGLAVAAISFLAVRTDTALRKSAGA